MVRREWSLPIHKSDEQFFSNKRNVWGDIEKALGEYDEENIFDFCKPDEEFDYDHPTRSIDAVEGAPEWIFKPTLDKFHETFKTWVDSIDISNTEKLWITSRKYLFDIQLHRNAGKSIWHTRI